MAGHSLRGALHFAIGVVIAALVLQTFLAIGWIVPVTVSGSSMAPALLGPHRIYTCADCRCEFGVGLDQLPRAGEAICPDCGRRRAVAVADFDRPGERLTIDRNVLDWRAPRRWEAVVFRCPEDASQLCVKRVAGLPGEAVALDDGDVFVDEQMARKSFAEQRAVRQVVYPSGVEPELKRVRMGQVIILAPQRWHLTEAGKLAYRHLDDGPITDESSYNQGVTPPANRVADVMLTFAARLSGDGRLSLSATNQFGRFDLVADLELQEVTLRIDDRFIRKRPLPTSVAGGDEFDEWTFSLFDRQVLLAIDDQVVLVETWDCDRKSVIEDDRPLAIGVAELTGEIRRLAVWRDVYYAVRYGDGRQAGAIQGVTTTWLLGPAEFFVLGDNAAISDDSRSWRSGPGIDAKRLIGKPLGVR